MDDHRPFCYECRQYEGSYVTDKNILLCDNCEDDYIIEMYQKLKETKVELLKVQDRQVELEDEYQYLLAKIYGQTHKVTKEELACL